MTAANTFHFSRHAEKRFKRLDKKMQDRLRLKLRDLKSHENIEAVLKHLTAFEPATHRLRLGDFRLILQKLSDHEFLVLDIGHRSTVYR
jgi:mRNA-degrading endonuclease RelE of RelBE toxin-antitoxin system